MFSSPLVLTLVPFKPQESLKDVMWQMMSISEILQKLVSYESNSMKVNLDTIFGLLSNTVV